MATIPSVRSRATRCLGIARYHPLVSAADRLPDWAAGVLRQSDEEWIGFYENDPLQPADNIVLSDRGMHIRRDTGWEFIAYRDIVAIASPTQKEQAADLTVSFGGGGRRLIPIRGGDGRFRDVFSFLRFLGHVVRDAQAAAAEQEEVDGAAEGARSPGRADLVRT